MKLYSRSTFLILAMAGGLDAALMTVPPGLPAGAHYRLMYVTSTGSSALSTDIDTYNTFVSNNANSIPELAALGATWRAMGSTATVDAIDNIGTEPGVPIYRLDGFRIVDDATTGPLGLFSGGIPLPFLATISITELGTVVSTDVWTGTWRNGVNLFDGPLGGTNVHYGNTQYGVAPATVPGWTTLGMSSPGSAAPILHPLYAISSTLIVVDAVEPLPEPDAIGLTALGGTMLCFLLSRKRRSCE